MTAVHAGFTPSPAPAKLLEWLQEGQGGAVELVTTRGKPPGLEADAVVEFDEMEKRAHEIYERDGVRRVLLTHVTGVIEPGEPVALVGASADHRDQAFDAVDALLERLSGVARRQDLPE